MATVAPRSTKRSLVEIVRKVIRRCRLDALKFSRKNDDAGCRCNKNIFRYWGDNKNPNCQLHGFKIVATGGWDDSNNADFEKVRFSIEPDEPIEYAQYPKKTQHYWYKWMLTILEESCFEFGQHHLQEYLADDMWRSYHLRFGYLYRRDHSNPEHVDLWDWVLTIKKVMEYGSIPSEVWDPAHFNRKVGILWSVEQFRHLAIHRKPMPIWLVRDAMKLPTLFQDQERAAIVQMVYEVVEDNFTKTNVGEEATEKAMKLLYPHPDDLTYTTYYQLLRRIQELLEQSCFSYGTLREHNTLVKNGWESHEDVELPEWRNLWMYARGFQHPLSKDCFPDRGRRLFSNLIRRAADLRNDASHRRIAWEHEDACLRVRQSIMLVILLGERAQAVEIEIVWQQWMEKSSRAAVLARLREDFPQEEGAAAKPAEELRKTWMFVDVFMEGEEDMKEALSGESESESDEDIWGVI